MRILLILPLAGPSNDDLTDPSFQALLKCNCNKDLVVTARKLDIGLKHISIPTCLCRDLDLLSRAPNPDKLAMYNLATKPCSCGSGLATCSLPAHLGAIEGISASYDKLQEYEEAYKFAALHVIMAPHSPEGYLRMAKALRMMDPSKTSDTDARCTWIYYQALQSVRTYGDRNHEKLKVCSYAPILRQIGLASFNSQPSTY